MAARKFAIKPASPPNSDINITPLVDVVLVLLIIFMVVTPLLEKDIEVKVPESQQVEEQSEVPPDQLVVALDKDGAITINTDKVSDTDYPDKIKRMVAAKAKGDRVVFFTADDKTSYAKLVAALDGARKGGAEVLGMATDKIEAPKAPEAPVSPDAPQPPDVPTPPAPPPAP
jgi:biopolymer transport protein ExbD/biopolymer transport protein TolR